MKVEITINLTQYLACDPFFTFQLDSLCMSQFSIKQVCQKKVGYGINVLAVNDGIQACLCCCSVVFLLKFDA